MTLDVLISTCGPGGAERVAAMELPHAQGVRYVVSWQGHGGAPVPPQLAGRTDTDLFRLDTPGLSNNRNNAIAHSHGDIRLTADDDLHYTAEQLAMIIEVFERNPELDMATFMYEGPDAKRYPPHGFRLTDRWPKGYFITSFETAVRASGPAGSLRYDTRFGLGSDMFTIGEDDMFLLEALHRGMDVRFYPIVITRHEGLTTGLRHMAPQALAGSGAVIRYMHPLTCLPRIALKAFRLWRAGQAGLLPALYHGLRGAAIATFSITPTWKE